MDLQRFLDAQAPVIDAVMTELEAGTKRSHWMWFVFPQLRTLGRSSTALFYGLESVDEAKAYLAQPVLGDRLRACTRAVLGHRDRSAHAIFGSPDDLAAAAIYLASNEAGYVTGQTLHVNGGMAMV